MAQHARLALDMPCMTSSSCFALNNASQVQQGGAEVLPLPADVHNNPGTQESVELARSACQHLFRSVTVCISPRTQFMVGAMLALTFWTTGLVKRPQVNGKVVSIHDACICSPLIIAVRSLATCHVSAEPLHDLTSAHAMSLLLMFNGLFSPADLEHPASGCGAHPGQPADQCVPWLSGSFLHTHHQGALLLLCPGTLVSPGLASLICRNVL